jgi:hypothetical protein
MNKKNTYILITCIAFISAVCCIFIFKSEYYCIPVTFNGANRPLVEVNIGKKVCLLDIDTGSSFPLSLEASVLSEISKKLYGTAFWEDLIGNSYEAPVYVIPKIKIGALSLRDLKVKQEREDFLLNTTLWSETNRQREQQGTIGRPFLEIYNLLLDFPRSRVIICNQSKKLKELGFNLEKMVKASLEEGNGIIISIDTDFGRKKFDFDTGSTLNLIRSSLLDGKECNRDEHGIENIMTTRFTIGEKNFGPVRLSLYNITAELDELDGIIGMEFLRNHVVYIDYRNKAVYIGE